MKEGRCLGSLAHAHIVKVHDVTFCMLDGTAVPCVVMELVEGADTITGYAQLGTWTVSNGTNGDRDHPGTFDAAGATYAVNAGDLVTLSFLKSDGQTFGSLVGLTESFTFTAAVAPTPLPAAFPLFASGLIGLGWLGRRKV